MRELPTGTVTFLFTDIEGSTKLLETQGKRYGDLLAEHRRVLRAALARHGGVEVDTQGDAFFVAFARASDALAAAEEAQTTLELPVRMGIHTGEPQLTEEGYVGMDVHRAARICSAAHGSQVVVSDTTARLVENASLRDLGEHRLKDLRARVRLYQLGEDDFPPLRSLNQTNLPAQPGELVGRERELAELAELLRRDRLVTLTGPGGSGKTRLALHTAAELVDDFQGGVFFVPLASVTDPTLVLPTMGQTIGAHDGLAEHIGNRELLLLLDNLEHVVEVAPDLAQLLEGCSNLRLLITSRTLLRIAGERDYPVEPLVETDAVTLFTDRAAVGEPLKAVHEICRRLDGLPLAIELAAARTRLLPPDRLLERLDRALPVLTGGRRDAPERQRTLRATIEWSYDLLEGDEQELFRFLAVFAGSFTVEAAEEVCGADLDTLESLVEKSLLRHWASGRLGMLETIREYAEERLDQSGEREEIARRHAEFFREVAESANLMNESEGPQRHEVAIAEQHNLRAAIDWALETDPELGLRIAVALENFWVTNAPAEGKRRYTELLERTSGLSPELVALAYRCRGSSESIAGELEEGHRDYERALAGFRRLGDELRTGIVLFRLGVDAARDGDQAKARELLRESLALHRGRFPKGEAQALTVLGDFAFEEGRDDEALELLGQSAELCRECGFLWWEGNTRQMIADWLLLRSRPAEAAEPARRALAIAHQIGDRQGTVETLALLAWHAAQLGDAERAGRLWGAIEAEEERSGPVGQWELKRAEYEERAHGAAAQAFERGRSEGRTTSLDEAAEYALSEA